MANVSTRATTRLFQFLLTPAGLSENLAAVAELNGLNLAEIGAKQVYTQNVVQELLERAQSLPGVELAAVTTASEIPPGIFTQPTASLSRGATSRLGDRGPLRGTP